MNEIEVAQKFSYIESIAKQNGIELLIIGSEIHIQKVHVLFKAESVSECYGFVFGYLKGIKNKNNNGSTSSN